MYHCYHYFRHGHVGTSHKNRSQGDIAPTQVSLLIHPIQITLYSDSSAPEMKKHEAGGLTVHVDRPESSDATLSPFSRVVTLVSGTFKTT